MNDVNTAISGKYLTFSLDAEEYGIPIGKVKEIIGMMTITGMPQMPAFIKGVINLRDHVIPVVDLRLKFAMPEAASTERTCIIVIESSGLPGPRMAPQVGVIVDSVSEVAAITEQQVEQAPSLWNGEDDCRVIMGIAKLASGIKILLDIDKVLASAELTSVSLPAHA